MSASLVGSEMCIRDRGVRQATCPWPRCPRVCAIAFRKGLVGALLGPPKDCLLYTSDAADDM
eukprot:5050395-Alexandrium_andersonii.AAC.1